MSAVGVTLSASAVVGLVAALLSLVGAVVALRKARQRQAELRTLTQDHQFWLFVERSVRDAGWGPQATETYLQTYLQYVSNMARNRVAARGLTHMRLYRPHRLMEARHAASIVHSSWFHAAMFFIPRKIRAPWFDHLLEDRERMAAEGRGRGFIAWATGIQCLGLLLHLLWERLWDLLTPFKPRSH